MKQFPSSVKRCLIAVIVAASASTVPVAYSKDNSGSAKLNNCINADPSSEVANVNGDFELQADPQDPAGNVIFISNLASGASSVVVAQVDGLTGAVISGSLTTVADNYNGQTIINGPEFVQKSTGELGMIYAGGDGVHGVFRSNPPTTWNAFNFDVTGAPTNGSPPPLPATIDGAYPIGKNILGINTYGQALGGCAGSACFSALGSGTYTDVGATMTAAGLTASGVALSPRDGYLFMSACDANNVCGLYEAKIDGAGGFVAGSLQQVAATADAPVNMAAVTAPTSGATVLFTDDGARAVDIWRQPATGGALTLISTIPVYSSAHYRVAANSNEVVLNYLIRSGLHKGSYTIAVPTVGGSLTPPSTSTKISTVYAGTEFDWLPAAGQWALFFRPSQGQLTRCWVNP